MDERGITDEVVAAAQRGDATAFGAIYNGLAGSVCGYLRAKGVSDPEAITSDVFLAVLPRLSKVTGGAAGLRALVFSIAHARMVDDHRERARRPVFSAYELIDDTRTVDSAEDEAQLSLATERVFEVLDVLPPDQREVVSLRVVADLPVEQVAEIMGRSVGAVKQLHRRGVMTIRRALQEQRVML